MRLIEIAAAAQLAAGVVESQPGDMDARLFLVNTLLAKHDLKAADRELAVVVANKPDSADVQTAAGILAAMKKDAESSRRAYQRAR